MAKYDDRGVLPKWSNFVMTRTVSTWQRDGNGSFPAQKALILLTDLAHNLLADFHHTVLAETPFADFGPKAHGARSVGNTGKD